MQDAEVLRQVLALGMLGAASVSDIRSGRVWDWTWLGPASAGAVLFIAPGSACQLPFLAAGAAAGVAWIAARAGGTADGLGIIALSVVLPSHGGMPVGLEVPAGAVLLAGACSLCRNLACNAHDAARGGLWEGVCDAGHRKALAFLVLHRARRGERFAVSAQEGKRLVFRLRAGRQPASPGQFASSAVPLVPFMLAALVLVLA